MIILFYILLENMEIVFLCQSKQDLIIVHFCF